MSGVQVLEGASPNVFFMFANDNSKISKITPNHDFQMALRYGINYAGLLQLAGAGSIQDPGIVPSAFLGALPASDDAKYDLAQAKAYLAKSGVGNPTLNLTYPTDLTENGLSFDDLAARLQQYLDQIGITVKLQPQSISVGLGTYRAGTEALGLWFWGLTSPTRAITSISAREPSWACGQDGRRPRIPPSPPWPNKRHRPPASRHGRRFSRSSNWP